MSIPSSGPLTLTTIQTEFGGSNPASLSEYYAGGGLVPSGTSGAYGAVPSSGQISIQNFYGTQALVHGSATYTASGNFTVPAAVTSLTVKLVGGGASATKGQNHGGYAQYASPGNGGGGGGYRTGILSVTPGQVISFTVGGGGAGGNTNTGNNGGTSSVSTVYAYGGVRGGSGGAGGSGAGGSGGSTGGNGVVGAMGTICGGAGGAGASTYGGAGGIGGCQSVYFGTAGSPGNPAGGGGGGGGSGQMTGGDAGAGARGVVVFEW